MTCCSSQCAAATFFSSRIAESDLRRYQRRGPDASTRMILSELRGWPLKGLHLLDVGAGVGVIAAELAASGVASATLSEASPSYLEVARRNVGSRYSANPPQFIHGDFAASAASLPEADIVTLDRVVCCYPDVEALLRAAAGRARRLLAFSYPRDRWYMRFAMGAESFFLWLGRSPFRVFVHSPQRMASILEAAGLVRAAHQETILWSADLYRRPSHL